MSSAYSQVEKNKLKTALLMLIFSAMVFLIGYLVSIYIGSTTPIYLAAGGALFANISAFWFSDKLALSSAGAHLADEEEYKELHRLLENLSITAGIPKPRLYIIDDPSPNAFATGRDPKHAAVAVTTGLLSILDRSELEGVLAHELSHIANRDTLVMTVAVVLVGVVGILADLSLRAGLWGSSDRDNKNPIFLWLFIIVLVLAPIVAQLLQLAVSRKREFLADSSGALLTRYPEGLANALLKISKASVPMRRASVSTAHLFISNPFGTKGAGAWMSKLFSTHPPVEERVKALLEMQS